MTERVTVDGVEYEMTVADPACGFWHYHDDPHADDTPGQPQHHHHDERCQWRTALLKPVGGPWIRMQESADLYRYAENGQSVVVETIHQVPEDRRARR